jgi:prepilin-type N-terminal cleavage/methylation domain-containing protein
MLCRHKRYLAARQVTPAFTLIELLVVIVIIAILCALLFPTVAWVRYLARTVVCVNDKRQIVQAAMAFAGDHNGVYPTTKADCIQPQTYHDPADHSGVTITNLNAYSVPWHAFICAVQIPSATKRRDWVKNQAAATAARNDPDVPGCDKFIARTVQEFQLNTWWVCRRTENAICDAEPCIACVTSNGFNRNIIHQYMNLQSATQVVTACYLNVDQYDNVYPHVTDIDGKKHYDTAAHTFRGKVVHSVVACADGHVEVRKASEIKNRFYVWDEGGSYGY